MVKVKILKTDEIKEVSKSEAHRLIETGVAELVKTETFTGTPKPYKNRQMRTTRKIDNSELE